MVPGIHRCMRQFVLRATALNECQTPYIWLPTIDAMRYIAVEAALLIVSGIRTT